MSPRQLRAAVHAQSTVLEPRDIAHMFDITVDQVEKILDDLDVPLAELPGLDGPRRRRRVSPENNFDKMLSEHGTPAGFARHMTRNEKACQRCLRAHAALGPVTA